MGARTFQLADGVKSPPSGPPPRGFRTSLLLGACLLWPASSEAAVTWKADFETGNLSQFSNGTMGAQDIQFVSDPVQQGKTAGKFTVHPNDVFGGSQMRVLINHSGARTGEGQDVFLSFYFRFDVAPQIRDNIAYWESNGSFRNMMTWWLAPKVGGGTTLDFGTGNLGSTKHLLTVDVSIATWHQLAFHVHWSTNPQMGNITVWLDGNQVVDEKAQTKPDGNSIFFQAGIHRGSRSSLVDSIFFDNFLEGESTADIMLLPPGSGADGGASQDTAVLVDAPEELAGGSGGSDPGPMGTGGSTQDTGAVDRARPAITLTGESGCRLSGPTASTAGAWVALAMLLGATALRRRRR